MSASLISTTSTRRRPSYEPISALSFCRNHFKNDSACLNKDGAHLVEKW